MSASEARGLRWLRSRDSNPGDIIPWRNPSRHLRPGYLKAPGPEKLFESALTAHASTVSNRGSDVDRAFLWHWCHCRTCESWTSFISCLFWSKLKPDGPLCVLYERTADGKNAANGEWQKNISLYFSGNSNRKGTKAFVAVREGHNKWCGMTCVSMLNT